MTPDPHFSLYLNVNTQALHDATSEQGSEALHDASPQSQDAFRHAMGQQRNADADTTANPEAETEMEDEADSTPRHTRPTSGDSEASEPAHTPQHEIADLSPPPRLALEATSKQIETAAAPALAAGLRDALFTSLDRLLVSDDRSELRLDLKDEILPGVSVRLAETEGRLTVCFTCSVDSVRRQLSAHIDDLARELAQHLQRDALIQVQTDDPHDMRLTETLGHSPH